MGNSNRSVQTDYLEQIKKNRLRRKDPNRCFTHQERQRVGGKSGETGKGKAEQTDTSTTETTTV